MRAIIFALILLLMVLQYTLWFGKGGIRDVNLLRQTVAEQQADIGALKARNQALAAEVRDLKQGMEAIEELARSEMGMVKEGEVFFQILKPESAPAPFNPEGDDE